MKPKYAFICDRLGWMPLAAATMIEALIMVDTTYIKTASHASYLAGFYGATIGAHFVVKPIQKILRVKPKLGSKIIQTFQMTSMAAGIGGAIWFGVLPPKTVGERPNHPSSGANISVTPKPS
jgi:hypothetical protein